MCHLPWIIQQDKMTKYYETVYSDHQVKKLAKAFRCVFDVDGNGVFEIDDKEVMVSKLRRHAKVDRGDDFYEKFDQMGKDLHDVLQDVASRNKELFGLGERNEYGEYPVDLDLFLNILSFVTVGSSKIEDFPEGLYNSLKLFFLMIDRNDDQKMSKRELARFYRDYCAVPKDMVDSTTEQAYEEWSENGTRPIDWQRYSEILDDYFFSKEPVGPGRLLLGPL